jgi:hypothetical protein
LIHLKGKKPIKYKWIFKRMTSIDEDVQTYKAILVIIGYKQR